MYLRIKNKNIYYYKLNPKKRKYIGKKVKEAAFRLQNKVESVDCTLEELFSIIEKDISLIAFISAYSNCPVYEFIEDIKKETEKCKQVEYVSINWYTEFSKLINGYPVAESFEVMNGIGYEKNGERERYNVSYSPLAEIKHCPIKLDNEIYMYSPQDYKTLLYSYKKNFTLLEFLNAIFHEISWHGGPKENEKFLQKLFEKVDEIESSKLTKSTENQD